VADYNQTDRVALALQATGATRLEQKHLTLNSKKPVDKLISTGFSKCGGAR